MEYLITLKDGTELSVYAEVGPLNDCTIESIYEIKNDDALLEYFPDQKTLETIIDEIVLQELDKDRSFYDWED